MINYPGPIRAIIIEQSLSGEAWSKDWINRDNKSHNYEEFLEDFNWIKTWSNNHFKIVVEKTLPVLIFLILNFLLFYFTKCLKKNFTREKNIIFLILLSFSLLSVFLWFIKFPLYRFGISYIYTSMILIFYFIFIKNINLDKLIKLKSLFIFMICLSFFGLTVKNILRIYEADKQFIYPSLVNVDRVPILKKSFDSNGNFTHYLSKGECGISKSPCTNFSVKVTKEEIYDYKVFTIDK